MVAPSKQKPIQLKSNRFGLLKKIRIEGAEKITPLLTTPKRLKVAVGGRGGSKSIFVGDCFLAFCNNGERLLCAREYQNSIDESVHSLLKARMLAQGYETLTADTTSIQSTAGGEILYKGLRRNPDAIKSMYGVRRVWIEEASTLSQHTLDVLMPTIREADSEIWMTLNRGASNDPVSETILKPYEDAIESQGYYEDDDILIVEINYYDNPWFPDVLERQRQRDKAVMPRAKYDHIWLGKYSDTVDNAIIYPEWFDACVDAHIKLGFNPEGAEVVAHDPSDVIDSKGLVYMYGSVIVDAQIKDDGDVNSGCDWAMSYAAKVKPDLFTWDGDGMGTSLRRQINENIGAKNVRLKMFKGSNTPEFPDQVYEPLDGEMGKPKTNRQMFLNARAQGYWWLRDRMYRTWQAVEQGVYHDPAELISISSKIEKIGQFRSEVCRIPMKNNGAGKIQLMTKQDMLKLGIKSPNMADSAMMAVAGMTTLRKADRPAVDYSVPVAFSAFA